MGTMAYAVVPIIFPLLSYVLYLHIALQTASWKLRPDAARRRP